MKKSIKILLIISVVLGFIGVLLALFFTALPNFGIILAPSGDEVIDSIFLLILYYIIPLFLIVMNLLYSIFSIKNIINDSIKITILNIIFASLSINIIGLIANILLLNSLKHSKSDTK